MSVSIVTDSAAALPADVAEAAGVTVVPLWLTIGGAPFRDGELPIEEVLRRFHEGVTTSGPTSGEILAAVEARAGEEGALVLTVASSMSSTHDAARMAARLFAGDVRVLDTRTAAGAQGLVVLAAARRAREGGSLDEVEAVARRAASRVRLVASLANLDWLVKSGHVPGVAAWAGRSIGLRPVLELRAGKVRPLRPALSDEAAFERVVGAWRRSRREGARLHVAALHALEPERADRLLAAVRTEVEPATAVIGPFSPVMVVHTGPSLFGLAWWWEEPGTG